MRQTFAPITTLRIKDVQYTKIRRVTGKKSQNKDGAKLLHKWAKIKPSNKRVTLHPISIIRHPKSP